MLVKVKGLSRPVGFIDCGELADGLASILRGWSLRSVNSESAPAPAIRVRRMRRGYQCVSCRLATPSACRGKIRADLVPALCVLHSELITERLAEDDTLVCLHCAAVEVDGGLVILIGPFKAGKSTLSVHLAAAGARLFCDDVLYIAASANHGIAPGFLPRLRLPLPSGLSGDFIDFLGRRTGPHDERSLYVDLREDEIAPLGTAAPIRGIVHLERRSDPETALIPMARDETLKLFLGRNIARGVRALDLLDRLLPIVGAAECFALRYVDCEAAVALLCSAFGGRAAGRMAA
jgi:hypothetical protein